MAGFHKPSPLNSKYCTPFKHAIHDPPSFEISRQTSSLSTHNTNRQHRARASDPRLPENFAATFRNSNREIETLRIFYRSQEIQSFDSAMAQPLVKKDDDRDDEGT